MFTARIAFLFVLIFASLQVRQSSAQNVEPPSAPVAKPHSAVEEEVAVLSVTAGFIYLQNDLTDTPGGTSSYLLGWYGIPEYHVNKHLSVFADFTNLYNFHAHQAENVHGFAGGPEFDLPLHRITAFAYAEGGAARDSRAGRIVWSPSAAGGVGSTSR